MVERIYVLGCTKRVVTSLLSAKTKTGKKICLGYDFKKETLLFLRSSEEFFCPICEEKVSLKLGEKKIFHFAHQKGTNCREFFENETDYHLKGKLQLFHWLKKQRIPAELEFYDKEIRQRPDILFVYQGKKYALEYQCSAIPEEIFTKRTENYIESGYIPFWILGGNHFQQSEKDTSSISHFHYLFLRKSSSGEMFIPYYCSEKKLLYILTAIFPYTIKQASAQKIMIPLEKMKLESVLDQNEGCPLELVKWCKKERQHMYKWSSYPTPQKRAFFNEIYNQKLNIFLFPPEIGLPVPHMLLIQTPSFIWQTYFYLDILKKKHLGNFIHLSEVKKWFEIRVNRGDISIRYFPQEKHLSPFKAYFEYLLLLEKLGFLGRVQESIFQIKKEIYIPTTNKECAESLASFYRSKHRILFKGDWV